MKTVYSDHHKLQSVETEFYRGKWVEAFEIPRRAQLVLDAVRRADLGPIVEPKSFDLAPVLAVHDPDFVRFLENVWAEWVAEVGPIPAYPNVWPPRRTRMIPTIRPGAELGRYAVDMSSPILEGTWRAARAAVDCALTGADFINAGDPSAFALCRPPGHHAGRDFFGGYCYLNNAAVAAQRFLDNGHARVAIFDVDYHHGNGTQEIFYERDDVLLASLHGDPDFEFPFHLGYARERGTGKGEGYNLNYPLPAGTAWPEWLAAFEDAHANIRANAPTALVVSLGVDTFKEDPISQFRLESEHFTTIGRRIADFGLPTLFVMEGGYAVEALGVNAVNVLQGFERG